MKHIVFILGAGASVSSGAPLMANFLERARGLLSDGQLHDETAKHFRRVFKAIRELQTVHSKAILDIHNIEAIFTTLEMANLLQNLPGHEREEIPGIIESLKRLIVVTLEQTVVFPVEKRGQEYRIKAPRDYEALVRFIGNLKLKGYSCSIITFNYDIALDFAIWDARMEVDYGIPAERPQRAVNAPKGVDEIELLKLHGSINWATSGAKVIPLSLANYANRASLSPQPPPHVGSQIRKQASALGVKEELDDVPLIVPPTWNKGEQYRSIGPIWQKAANALQKAAYIVVMGYSMPATGSFFPLLYALGASGSDPLLRYILVNPDPDSAPRFKSQLGPGAINVFRPVPERFGESSMGYVAELIVGPEWHKVV